MPLSERRRPLPLHLVPRQTPSPTPIPGAGVEEEEPESPDSPDSVATTPGPDSPDSLFSGEGEEDEEEGEEEEGDEEEGKEEEGEEEEAREGVVPSATSSIDPSATSTASITGIQASLQVSGIPIPAPTDDTSTSQRPTMTVTLPLPSAPPEAGAGGSNLGTEPQQETASTPPKSSGGMSKGAEAALVSLTVLGGLALILAALFFIRKRRLAKKENTARQTEDAFAPANDNPLPAPETAYTGHITRTTTTNSLFAAAEYARPETVSTDPSRSRMQGLPTPNPFADPPLNKAFDVLRGRPRSTTLTDRGSWVKNPFKDPVSERFDPFGEMQQKARLERERYMEELRLEQEYDEKEKMGLVPAGLPGQNVRKSSGVTVEGVGILDRSGDNKTYPR